MAESWRGLIAERYENGMFRVKPPIPLVKVEDIPKKSVVEFVSNTCKDIKEPDVVPIHNEAPEYSIKEDQAAEMKSDEDIEEINLDNISKPIGVHKLSNLKVSWVENKSKNKGDLQTLEWGREPNISFVTGKIQFPVPMFWDSEGHKLHFEDSARGSSVILAGPSGQQYSGHHCIGVNNKFYSMFKFITSSFDDININMFKSQSFKFMPLEYARKIRPDGVYNFHSPFNCYYMRNDKYQRNNFWYEDSFFYDDNIAYNDLIVSLRLLHIIGYRTVFLDGFVPKNGDFSIYDDVIKNSVGKLKIFDIGINGNIRNIEKFNRSKAMSLCILL